MKFSTRVLPLAGLFLCLTLLQACSATDEASPEISNSNNSSNGSPIQPAQAPLAFPDNYQLSQSVSNEPLDVLVNDQGAAISISNITSGDQGGTISIAPDQLSLSYTPPDPNFIGREQFQYFIINADGLSSSTTVTVDIIDPNLLPGLPPIAVFDARAYETDSNMNSIDALGNDLDSTGANNPANLMITSVTSTGTAPPATDPNDPTRITTDGTVIDYTPIAGFIGVESLTYEITDITTGQTSTAMVIITVSPLGSLPPVALADTQLAETTDSMISINVLQNDFDSQGTLTPANLNIIDVTSSAVVPPSNGDDPTTRISIAADGQSITYTPPAVLAAAVETLMYTIEDINSGQTSMTTVVVTITPQLALPPIAVPDVETAATDTPIVIAATDNDLNANGVNNPADLTITAVSSQQVLPPATGDDPTARISFDAGNINYTPPAGFTGIEILEYTITDNNTGGTSTAQVVITTSPLGSVPPVAVADLAFAINNEGQTTIAVLGNDLDAAGNIANATSVTITEAVSSLLQPDVAGDDPTTRISIDAAAGTLLYTPPSDDFIGSETLMYTIQDNNTGGLSTAAVIITVTPGLPNAPPVGVPSVETTQQGIVLNAMVTAIDANQDTLSYSVDMDVDAASGTLSLQADGNYTYTPADGFTGTALFTFIANDGMADSAPTLVTIVVLPNLPPVGMPAAILVDPNTTENGALSATDPDTSLADLTFQLVANPITGDANAANGIATVNADGTFSYTPNQDYAGPDTFYFVANDGASDSAPTLVSVVVSPLPTNFPPVGIPGVLVVDADSSETGTLAGTDPNAGDTLTFSIATAPSFGTIDNATFDASTGSYTYTPNAGYFGPDSFTFVVTDDSGAQSAATTVAITVAPIVTNVAPLALPSVFAVQSGETISGQVVAQDANPGDTLTYTRIDNVSAGNLTFNTDGSFTYDATGVAATVTPITFTFQANDGTADSNIATVSISVTAVSLPNTIPRAVPQLVIPTSITSLAGGVYTGTLSGQDVDGPDPLTFQLGSIVTDTVNGSGSFTLDTNSGAFSFSPTLSGTNLTGVFSFTFTVNDGEASSPSATVLINFIP